MKFKVKRSSAGLGLFAQKEFKKGEFIVEYTGEAITHEEADRRGGRYLFTLNDNIVLDGKDRKHIARYINHSCDPNIEAVIEDEEHIMFYAIKDIKKNEEFTFDYGEEYVNDIIKKEGCRCKKCYKNNKNSH
jgi:SET domain-containing protein